MACRPQSSAELAPPLYCTRRFQLGQTRDLGIFYQALIRAYLSDLYGKLGSR